MTELEARKGKFVAVANMKGGVGKTTTVVSLAESLAADDANLKILVIDLDPQASASLAIAGDEQLGFLIDEGRTLEAFIEKKLILKERMSITDAIHPTICGTFHQGKQLDVALLPCGPKLRFVERELIFELARANFSLHAADGQVTKLFRSDILPLNKQFDFIIFDCAPGISPVTEIAIRLSDFIIVPTIPDRLSVFGLNAFYQGIWAGESGSLPKPKSIPHVLVVRMDRRIGQHLEVLASLQEGAAEKDAGYGMFTVQVPTSAALVTALMKEDGLNFTQKYTSSVVSSILNPFVRELKGKL